MFLRDHTGGSIIIGTQIPFVIGQTDRFSYVGVNTTGRVDIWLEFQPGGTTRRIMVIHDPARFKTPGRSGYSILANHIVGPLPQ